MLEKMSTWAAFEGSNVVGAVWNSTADIIGVTRLGGQEQVGPYLDNNGNFIPAINTEALPIGGPTHTATNRPP